MTDVRPSPAILLVEDEPDILMILRRLVHSLTRGYEIVTTDDGETALVEVSRRRVPLVITDYHMPRMNGLSLAVKLKQRVPQTHIALITAYDNAELRKQAGVCGVDYYLPKPIPLATLEQIVREVLAST